MNDEPKNETVPPGEKDDKPVEDAKEPTSEPISLYDKTEAIVTRQEEANKKSEEILKRQETLFANQRLAGTAGGHVETEKKEETDQEYVERMRKQGWREDAKK